MTVRELLSRIDSAELTEWLAYYRLEPFGESVADQRHGIAASLVANTNRDPKRQREPFKPIDFIPWHPDNRKAGEAVLLDDPQAQAELIKQAIFRKRT